MFVVGLHKRMFMLRHSPQRDTTNVHLPVRVSLESMILRLILTHKYVFLFIVLGVGVRSFGGALRLPGVQMTHDGLHMTHDRHQHGQHD